MVIVTARDQEWVDFYTPRLAAAEARIVDSTKYLRRMLEHPYELEEAARRVTDALERAQDETIPQLKARIVELEAALAEAERRAGGSNSRP